jgi:hypothetical protein
MRGRAIVLVLVVLGVAACGSSSKKSTGSGTSATTSGAGSATVTTGAGSTTVTTGANGSASGTMTVSGGDTFSGTLVASNSETCSPHNAVSLGGRSSIKLSYQSSDGFDRELDVNDYKVGTVQLPGPTTLPSLRYTFYDEAGGGAASDYYDWGFATSNTKGSEGTLTITSKSAGKFNGTMDYFGDEGQHHPKNYKTAIKLDASWDCG